MAVSEEALEPRSAGGRLRHKEWEVALGRRLLAGQELLGHILGGGRLHPDGQEPQQHVRHCHLGQLPTGLGRNNHLYKRKRGK